MVVIIVWIIYPSSFNVAKPNHELQYNVGTDFCVEDAMSDSFRSLITCHLEREAIPTPEFLWNYTLELNSFNISHENDTLTLTGPINLGNTSALDITCNVSNTFGSDTANTSITVCGKLSYNLMTTCDPSNIKYDPGIYI